MFDLMQDLNEQANKVCKDLLEAKREAKANKGKKAAYHEGRAQELGKWLCSLEDLMQKLSDERVKRRSANEPE